MSVVLKGSAAMVNYCGIIVRDCDAENTLAVRNLAVHQKLYARGSAYRSPTSKTVRRCTRRRSVGELQEGDVLTHSCRSENLNHNVVTTADEGNFVLLKLAMASFVEPTTNIRHFSEKRTSGP